MSHVKNYDSVIEYFSDADTLVEAIKKYKEIKNLPKGELTLIDLLAE